jgi:hypothetical protein
MADSIAAISRTQNPPAGKPFALNHPARTLRKNVEGWWAERPLNRICGLLIMLRQNGSRVPSKTQTGEC